MRCIRVFTFLVSFFAFAIAHSETFEASLWEHGCDVSFDYSKENKVTPNELLGIGRVMFRLYTDTDEYADMKLNEFNHFPKKVVSHTNEVIKKIFSMHGDAAFYNLKVNSGKVSCTEE
tara:strand:- start:416 stop:769 length:354 start_codon:yes stop_codon:yes gene_type:complete